MIAERTGFEDSATLAAMVRDLARDAHRLLAGRPVADPGEVSALLSRLSEARRQLRGRRDGELRGWLDSLRRRLEALARAEAVAEALPA